MVLDQTMCISNSIYEISLLSPKEGRVAQVILTRYRVILTILFLKKQDSFIEDTLDMLRYFKEVNETISVPKNYKPISLDLKSMYTIFPIDEGIEAFRIELDKREDQTIPTEFLIKLLRLVWRTTSLNSTRSSGFKSLGQPWERE